MKNAHPLTFAAAILSIGVLAGSGITACSMQPPKPEKPAAHHGAMAEPATYKAPLVVPGRTISALDSLIEQARGADVILVGETHDRYEHHLTQLEIIKRLHESGEKLVVGMEFFHRPFQSVLDDYVAGRIDEPTMLRKSEYFRRWGFDYRLYQPILSYAQEHGIPLAALNADKELTDQVRKLGIDGLQDSERQRLPATIDRSNDDYAERLHEIFKLHPGRAHGDEKAFERFMDVQLIWDETMAQSAAEAMKRHPDHKLVVLAGSGHIAYGHGIPDRLRRILGKDRQLLTAVLMSSQDVDRDLADFLLIGPALDLPPSGKIGIFMMDSDNGVRVAGLAPGGAAEKAEIPTDSIIESIDGTATPATMDVRLALLGKAPGDVIKLSYRTKPEENLRTIDLALGGALSHHRAPRKH